MKTLCTGLKSTESIGIIRIALWVKVGQSGRKSLVEANSAQKGENDHVDG